MRAVIQQISAPQGIADRVRHAARTGQRHDTLRRWGFHTAAGLLMIISIATAIVMTTSTQQKDRALAQAVLRHIETESHHLGNARRVEGQRVATLFDRFGAQLSTELEQITFAAECPMQGRTGIHLIMPGKVGPVSMLFMPGDPTDQPQAITTRELSGAIMPTTWGNLAVVGEPGEEISGLSARLVAATVWPTTH